MSKMNKEIAFVLGNGITRLEVNCESLLDYGHVYGCNRIYEEFAPTVLVSTDKGMAQEIQQSGYSSNHIHYTRKNNKILDSGTNILPNNLWDLSSGPAALGLACETYATYFYMIGMDLKGINNKINNIYAGTQHYKNKDNIPTHFDNWVRQVEYIMRKFPSKRFIHVNPLHNFTPDIWIKNDNLEIMSLYEFKRLINNMHNRIL